MSTLFLTHPIAFLLCVIVVAMLAKSLGTVALRALVDAVETRSAQSRALRSLQARLVAEAEAAEQHYPEDRERIATRLLAAWTVPHRDVNGNMHHEVIDAVLVAKAYGEADLILDASTKTPLEIVAAAAPPEPMTFAEMVAAQQMNGAAPHEREAS